MSTDVLTDDDLRLEEICWTCYSMSDEYKRGTNPERTLKGDPRCGACQGKVYYPTSFGLKVLEFVKRHLVAEKPDTSS